MRSCLVVTLSSWLLNSSITGVLGQGRERDPPVSARAWEFILGVTSLGISEYLRLNHPAPVSPELRAQVLASLPAEGELVPTEAERTKLSALDPILEFYRRRGTIEVRVVDVPYALVAIHGRAFLLITREALSLVNAAELQAIGAHELAHELFWDDYDAALKGEAYDRLQELELRCDGIAVMTLRVLGLDPAHLARAAVKLIRYNEHLGGALNMARQVSLGTRLAFIEKVHALLRAKR
jgi:hypothetical protein